MKFKGYDRKSALGIILIYVLLAIAIRFILDPRMSMFFIAIGMLFSGVIGLKNKSYAILSQEVTQENTEKMYNFMLYLNYLLIFLGAFILVQQL